MPAPPFDAPKGRRRFNTSERVALFLAADGHCEDCGIDLEKGWHADHVTPWSAGGPTDVINGAALCPPCNIRKGAQVTMDLRDWQRDAVDDFDAKAQRDYLASATPGAGKTRFACTLARRALNEGRVERVMVVVPTDALRQQWVDAAETFGLSLMPVTVPTDYDKENYDGCVATYAQLSRGAGAEMARHATRIPTFAVLDEIHHAGERKAWGDGLTRALENAVHRLALTGTPWRKKPNEPIPFVQYGPTGEVRTDFAYEYGAAVGDGVCRYIVFDAYEGEGRWIERGRTGGAKLGADLSDDDVAKVLQAIYSPYNEWIPSILREADAALTEMRVEAPDAGGLVVACTQWHAQEYADLLEKISGQRPTVATSDDPMAKANIEQFRESTDRRWIVAVAMVSEGIDIPRLAVGVFASRTKTPLFFRQVVGRLVRIRPGEELTARLFIPALPAFMDNAMDIEQELRHQLDLESERDEKERERSTGEQRTFDLLAATPAIYDRSIFGGGEVTPAERTEAEAECRRAGIPIRYAVEMAGTMRRLGEVTHTVTVTPKPSAIPRYRHEKLLRGEVEDLARRLAHREGREVREVNTDLLREGFPKRSQASLEALEEIRDYLIHRLGEL